MVNRGFIAVFILMAGISSCTKDHAARVDTSCTSCADTLSFKTRIVPILQANCATSGCHNLADEGGTGLVLDSTVAYDRIMNYGPGYLNPGDAASSTFYIEIAPGSSNPMPPSAPLDVCDINRIKCWINQGALNN